MGNAAPCSTAVSAANKTRRSVMLMAWASKRFEPTRPFSDCLRGAWKFTKDIAKTAAKFAAKARRNGGWTHLSPSLIRSPASNRHGYGTWADRNAGRMISRVSR